MSPYPSLVSSTYALPYLVVFICYWLFYLLASSKRFLQTYSYSHAVFAVLLIYFFFIGFRGYICTDWYNYYPMFLETPAITNWSQFVDYSNSVFTEKGYLLYISMFKVICGDYVIFQSFSVLLDLLLIHICLKKYSSDYLLTFVILSVFFYVQSVNLNRNIKSILLFLYSIQYIQQRQAFKYFAINAIGFCFHITSLIFFPLYFILRCRIPNKVLWILLIVGVLLCFLQIPLFSFFAESIDGIIGGKIGHMIHRYFSREGVLGFNVISIGTFERIFTFSLLIFNYRKICNHFQYGVYFANLLLLYLLCNFFLTEIPILVTRLGQLFSFSYGIFYAYIVTIYQNSKNISICKFAIFCYLGLWTFMTHKQLMDRYDNFLFPHQSYEERARIYDHYGAAYLGGN